MPDVDYNRKGALARLRGGHVTVLHAERLAGNPHLADVIVAKVASTRENARPHRVDYLNGGWTCTCGITGVVCVHVAAVRLVTGHLGGAS